MKETRCLNPGCIPLIQYDEKELKKGWTEILCKTCSTVQFLLKCKNQDCSALFQVRKTDLVNNTKEKNIRCPKCNHDNRINSRDFSHTVINPNLFPQSYGSHGHLVISEDSSTAIPTIISLKTGENTIGRKAESSNATIQLPTNDRYMGRNHCKIKVLQDSRGLYRHFLSDHKSLNGTFHNSYKLLEGEETSLTHNDIIVLGKTVIRFVYEEQK